MNSDVKKQLMQEIATLKKYGKSVPKELLAKIRPTKYPVTKKEIQRFLGSLAEHGKVIVTITGRKKRFTVFTFEGYSKIEQNASKARAARSLQSETNQADLPNILEVQ